MPYVEKEHYKISSSCRLHRENDLYMDQEEHKIHVDINEWRCGYCKKTFYAEKYLDKHFDNRHYNLLNVVCSGSGLTVLFLAFDSMCKKVLMSIQIAQKIFVKSIPIVLGKKNPYNVSFSMKLKA